MPNPYFDEGPDEEQEDPYIPRNPAPSQPGQGHIDAPETRGGSSGEVRLPEWATLAGVAQDEEEEVFEPDPPTGFAPVPTEFPVPATAPAPPQLRRPAKPSIQAPKQEQPVAPVSFPAPEVAEPTPPAPVAKPTPRAEQEPVVAQPVAPAPVPPAPEPEELPAPPVAVTPPPAPRMMPRETPPSTSSNVRTSRYVDEFEEEPRRRREESRYEEDDYSQEDEDQRNRYRDYQDEIDEELAENTGFRGRRKNKEKSAKPLTPKPSRRETKRDKNSDRGHSQKSRGGSKFAGGRLKVLVLRIVVWSALGIVFAVGVKQMIAPVKVDIPVITNQVAESIRVPKFPATAGASLAEDFLSTYFTYNSLNGNELREEALLGMLLPSEAEIDLTFPGVEDQKILNGPVQITPPLVGDDAALLTYSMLLETKLLGSGPNQPKWVYVQIPVVYTEEGIAIAGLPGFIPKPSTAKNAEATVEIPDEEATNSFAPDLPRFLDAWAKSDKEALKRYLTGQATKVTTEGLNNLVTFNSVTDLVVGPLENKPNFQGSVRDATATVVWNFNGSTITNQYHLVVFQGADGRWYIVDIIGGGFN